MDRGVVHIAVAARLSDPLEVEVGVNVGRPSLTTVWTLPWLSNHSPVHESKALPVMVSHPFSTGAAAETGVAKRPTTARAASIQNRRRRMVWYSPLECFARARCSPIPAREVLRSSQDGSACRGDPCPRLSATSPRQVAGPAQRPRNPRSTSSMRIRPGLSRGESCARALGRVALPADVEGQSVPRTPVGVGQS